MEVGVWFIVVFICFPPLIFFFYYDKGPPFQSKKSYMLTFHYFIQSSLPVHLTTFPKLFVFERELGTQVSSSGSGWGFGLQEAGWTLQGSLLSGDPVTLSATVHGDLVTSGSPDFSLAHRFR